MGYSGISGSFSLCNARKNNQGRDVDNQGGAVEQRKKMVLKFQQINSHKNAIQ
jgi:hypothetical protein